MQHPLGSPSLIFSFPSCTSLRREWFRTYKIPDGKPENKFGLEGRCMNAAYAMHVVDEVRPCVCVCPACVTV